MALQLEWGLNEGTGTSSADSSGHGHNATVSGWAAGHTSFGATNAKFVGSLISSPTGFTILGWAFPLRSNAGDTLLAIGDGEAANSWWFEIDWADSTHLQIDIQAPGHSQQTAIASVTTALNAWVYVAMSWSASTGAVKLSIGGTVRATLTAAGAFSSVGFLTGGSWDFYGNNNVTVVDDARLDDTELSPAAITTYMNTPAGGATQYPVSGTVLATTATHGSIQALRTISGRAAGASIAAARMTARRPVTGRTAATSVSAASLTALHPVSGRVAASSATAATVGRMQAVDGGAAATTAMTGSVSVIPAGGWDVSGTVEASSDSIGTVHQRASVAGHTDAISTSSGTVDLVAHEPVAVTGTVAVTSAAHGAVMARRAVAGITHAAAVTRATLAGRLTIGGDVVAVSSVHGTVSGGYAPVFPAMRTLVGTAVTHALAGAAPDRTLVGSGPSRTLKGGIP